MLRAACSKLRLALPRARVSLAGQPLLRRSAAPYHAHRGRRILPFRPPNRSRQYPNRRLPSASTVFIFLKPRPTAAGAPRRSLALLRSGLIRFAEPALIFGIDANIMSFGADRRSVHCPFGPCLPGLADKPSAGPDWIREIELDGFRILAHLRGRSIRLATRNGHDLAERFALAADAVAAPPVKSCYEHACALGCEGICRSGWDRRIGSVGRLIGSRSRIRQSRRCGDSKRRIGVSGRVGARQSA